MFDVGLRKVYIKNGALFCSITVTNTTLIFPT